MKSFTDTLLLSAHPEGGFYREYYRSTTIVPTASGDRSASTAIYFMLPKDGKSMLHRIASDEIWCWHRGGTITLHCISSDGTYTNVQLGSFEQQGVYATVVSAGSWFGARASDADVLVSAIVAPGFDFADFEMGNRQRLLAEYPQHTRLIEEFTQ